MIPFFRKIRLRLASNNQPASPAGRFLKYSRYAIGEIFLVVIGILIALYINNWNETRKKKEKFYHSLINVQKELELNISTIDGDIPSQFITDSLTYIFRNRLLTKEMLLDPKNNYFPPSVVYYHSPFTLQNEAFKNLFGQDIEYDKTQDSIIRLLKDIFISKKNDLDKIYDKVGELISSELLNLSKTKGWYGQLLSKKLTKEMSNYFLKDSMFVNHVFHYSMYQIQNYFMGIQDIRYNSIKAHRKISKYLNKRDTLLNYKIDDFKHYIGVYKDSIRTIKIETKDDKLIYIFKRADFSETVEIYPVSKSQFTTGFNDGFYTLLFDEDDHVISQRYSDGINREEYLKVE